MYSDLLPVLMAHTKPEDKMEKKESLDRPGLRTSWGMTMTARTWLTQKLAALVRRCWYGAGHDSSSPSAWRVIVWMPKWLYPLSKRLLYRWIWSATFHSFPKFRFARVEFRRGN